MKMCNCGSESESVSFLYSCSGAANTGFLADQVARNLMKKGRGKMTCLSAVAARLSGFLQSAKNATKNIVIDGCSVACGKQIFDDLGFAYKHITITDFGVEKGKTEMTPDVVDSVINKIVEVI